MASFVLVTVLFFTLIHYGCPLHCLSHDHCGEHAACVTNGVGSTPKCMCLLGYYGNGASCTESGSPVQSSVRVGTGSGKKVDDELLRRTLCKSSNPQTNADIVATSDGATDIPLIDLPVSERRESVQKETENTSTLFQKRARGRILTTTDSDTPKFVPISSLCPKLECDFDDGPCSYKNMLKSFWYVRDTAFFDTSTGEQSQNLVATVKGDESQEQYLTSDTVFLPERVNMTFEYFESDHFPHLQVCQDNTNSCPWTSDGKGGWRRGRIELDPGNHKVIFVAKELSHARSVAIDNIKIENIFGSPVTCT